MQDIYPKQFEQLKAAHAEVLKMLRSLSQRNDPNSASVAENKQKLARIEAALNRMVEGTYGLCTTCHQTVSWERLNTLPYAELCLSCQLAEERKEGE